MISHLFDTDMLTLFQHGHANVIARCAVAMPGSLAITIISVCYYSRRLASGPELSLNSAGFAPARGRRITREREIALITSQL